VRKTGAKNDQGFKKLRNRAEKSLRKGSVDLGKSPVADARKLIHELRVHQIELEMQNEELRKAQVELAESRRGTLTSTTLPRSGILPWMRKA